MRGCRKESLAFTTVFFTCDCQKGQERRGGMGKRTLRSTHS